MSYQYGYALQAPVHTDQRPQNGAVVAIAWVCAVLTLLYMLPWAIAATRGKSNQAMVGVINLLLGWSFIGWVVSLVMACTAHQVVHVPVAVLVAPPQQAYGQQYGQARYGQSTFGQPAYAQTPPPVQDAPVNQPAELPSVPSAAPVPAGWYASPSNQGQEYWDGTRWTGHRAP
jgi:hypothetical protein